MVEVHCTEGVANHSGPESCARIREAAGEALTGERTGQPWSRDISCPEGRHGSIAWKATSPARQRECSVNSARSETLACADAPCTGTGRSWAWPAKHRRSALGRRGAVAGDARAQEV